MVVKRQKYLPALIISILLAQLAGVVGSVFTVGAISTWYVRLVKPELAPPSFLFGPVWVTLYTLMGIAAFLVWRKHATKKRVAREALILYGFQLGLNALWSILFFGLRQPGLAFLEIVVLWVAIGLTMKRFRAVDVGAFWLLLPYWLWVSFAAYLNFALWQLN